MGNHDSKNFKGQESSLESHVVDCGGPADRESSLESNDEFGWILCKGARESNLEAVHTALKHSANVNFLGYQNFTPLHYASRKGNIEIMKLLIDNGADVDASTEKGETPLFLACFSGQVEAAQYLMSMGADFTRLNAQNQRAGDTFQGDVPNIVRAAIYSCVQPDVSRTKREQQLQQWMAEYSHNSDVIGKVLHQSLAATANPREQQTPGPKRNDSATKSCDEVDSLSDEGEYFYGAMGAPGTPDLEMPSEPTPMPDDTAMYLRTPRETLEPMWNEYYEDNGISPRTLDFDDATGEETSCFDIRGCFGCDDACDFDICRPR